MEKVSVITVVYNNKEKIERTIKNVLSQTYQNLEYIVVDGASTDGTVDVIKKYSNRIKWISEPDSGIYDAMMKGVRMATGKWILFRNCGDFFYKSTSIEDVFIQYGDDSGEDFLIADSRLFMSWGYYDCKPSIINRSYQECMPVIHPSTFIRRTTQLKYPFNLKYKNSADFCFFWDAFDHGSFYRYYNIIISLVEMDSGVTANHYNRTLKENIDIMRNHKASSTIIFNARVKYFFYRIKTVVCQIIPSYRKYNISKLIKLGWVAQDSRILLKSI